MLTFKLTATHFIPLTRLACIDQVICWQHCKCRQQAILVIINSVSKFDMEQLHLDVTSYTPFRTQYHPLITTSSFTSIASCVAYIQQTFPLLFEVVILTFLFILFACPYYNYIQIRSVHARQVFCNMHTPSVRLTDNWVDTIFVSSVFTVYMNIHFRIHAWMPSVTYTPSGITELIPAGFTVLDPSI